MSMHTTIVALVAILANNACSTGTLCMCPPQSLPCCLGGSRELVIRSFNWREDVFHVLKEYCRVPLHFLPNLSYWVMAPDRGPRGCQVTAPLCDEFSFSFGVHTQPHPIHRDNHTLYIKPMDVGTLNTRSMHDCGASLTECTCRTWSS